jgi:hypothetical protein
MKYLVSAVAALLLIVALPTSGQAGDGVPIDTKALVIKPTKAVADLTSATIKIAGAGAASQIDNNGYVKTINNLFRKPTPTLTQPGPSPLPVPQLFKSTAYPNYNTPVMPISMPARR